MQVCFLRYKTERLSGMRKNLLFPVAPLAVVLAALAVSAFGFPSTYQNNTTFLMSRICHIIFAVGTIDIELGKLGT